MFAARASAAAVMCVWLPVPEFATVSLPGLALASATNSASDF
jgi:hypothetical protein